MGNGTKFMVLVCALGLSSGVAVADWNPGDPFKMHFPQLPDPNGWDVNITNNTVADDWLCTESGDVSDLHFWYSYRNDFFSPIQSIRISIHEDGASAGTPGRPGALLWESTFATGQFTTRLAGSGAQGWIDWNEQIFIPDDHQNYYQVNIEQIINPFVQEIGNIYWLDISVVLEDPNAQLGWKTSLDRFGAGAVVQTPNGDWKTMSDPSQAGALDMAFVITPAPGAAGLFACALATLAGRRRHR